jgi:hypothetical protein
MRKRSRNLRSGRRIATQSRLIAIALAVCLVGVAARSIASGAERAPDEPLRVAVYDVPPYGSVDAEGLFSGASVDLWRRVAEDLHLTYRLIAVAQNRRRHHRSRAWSVRHCDRRDYHHPGAAGSRRIHLSGSRFRRRGRVP